VSKRGLPTGVQMRHDSHYVENLATASRAIGKTIPIDRIEPNPEQPRSEFGDLTELTESIREKGVLEPLLVKPRSDGTYMIIAGERRWRSSKLAGLTEVPCIEMDLDEQGVAEIALIENLQRKDLNVWEEADGLKALADKFGYTQDEIAKKISKSRSTVTELMTIAGLPESVRQRAAEANINTKSALLEIARQFDDAAMHEFLDDVVAGRATPGAKQRKSEPTATESSKKATTTAKSDGSTFSYIGKDPSFELSINFASDTVSKGDILKALKQTFDSLKSQ
jgi:ParB family chromosome partitioning protein